MAGRTVNVKERMMLEWWLDKGIYSLINALVLIAFIRWYLAPLYGRETQAKIEDLNRRLSRVAMRVDGVSEDEEPVEREAPGYDHVPSASANACGCYPLGRPPGVDCRKDDPFAEFVITEWPDGQKRKGRLWHAKYLPGEGKLSARLLGLDNPDLSKAANCIELCGSLYTWPLPPEGPAIAVAVAKDAPPPFGPAKKE
jgi:hypothetical protein